MAYNFSADKQGVYDLQRIHERLSQIELVEFFPVDVKDEYLTLGISVPFKACDDTRLEVELNKAMTYLIEEQQFLVTDLFTGKLVRIENMPVLIKEILG